MTTAQGSSMNEIGFVGRIPVRNLWLLMLYASDLFQMGGISRVAVEESPDELPDLLAEILVNAVERRLRRQLSFGYRRREAVLTRVRGRIDLLTTERHQLLLHGKIACSFDELTLDTPRNRFVCAVLRRISAQVKRDKLAHRCRILANDMVRLGVTDAAPLRSRADMERFGRHDKDDLQMVAAAKLAFDLSLPSEDAGIHALPLSARDEKWVRKLFEKAVGGFYDVVLSPEGWQVKCGKWMRWQAESQTDGMKALLPSMQTDIVLEHTRLCRRIVIDTKFNEIVTKGRNEKTTFRSAYLYQMYAYLRSQESDCNALTEQADGLLLHPSLGEQVDETVRIQGHNIRFATVDLLASTQRIREDLLRVVKQVEF